MTISKLIHLLAEEIELSTLPRSETQEAAIDNLKSMPTYLVQGQLDLWEADFPWASTEDGTTIAKLLESIYDLGRYNLYTQFNSAASLREYKHVRAYMLEAGLTPPEVPCITGW